MNAPERQAPGLLKTLKPGADILEMDIHEYESNTVSAAGDRPPEATPWQRALRQVHCTANGVPAVPIFGTVINTVRLAEVFEAIDRQIARRRAGFVVTPNVDHLCQLPHNPRFAEAYRKAFLVLADGIPVVWASRLFRKTIPEKISGSDLIYWLTEHAARKGHSVFFFGAAPGVAEEAGRLLGRRYPGLKVAGHYSPPVGFENDPEENAKAMATIREAAPDICYVALGAPRQDIWNAENAQRLGVPVMLGIGASLDFVTGRAKRAPRWAQRSGVEWIWRLCMEPGRLWKRYLLRDSRFLAILWHELWYGVRKSAIGALNTHNE